MFAVIGTRPLVAVKKVKEFRGITIAGSKGRL